MDNWKTEAARELADILSLLLQGYFDDKQSLCDRIRTSTEALEIISEDPATLHSTNPPERASLTHWRNSDANRSRGIRPTG